jgi:hypothetical protein
MGSRKEQGAHRGAVIGAAGAVAAAVIGGFFVLLTKEPPAPECVREVVIDKPANGQAVDGAVGVDVTGSACGLEDDETVWVFEHDPFDQNFYLVYDPAIGPRPVASRNGGFAIHDGPVGDAGDERKPYEIVAVVGNAGCREAIEDSPADEVGNHVFRTLPDGCRDSARVQVLVSG